MNRMLFAVVNNQPEVLMRVIGTLRRRDFHMKSISMVETENPSLAHLMITTREENQSIERAMLLIEKFVDVYEVKKIEKELDYLGTKENNLCKVI